MEIKDTKISLKNCNGQKMQENMLETPEQTNAQTKTWQWDLGSVAEWLPIRKDASKSGWYLSTFLFVLPEGPFFNST